MTTLSYFDVSIDFFALIEKTGNCVLMAGCF